MRNKYDVIIIGAGIMGLATAYFLSKSRKNILVIDQLSINNSINSSSDYSRGFRYEYGDDEFYTELAVKSLVLWKTIERVMNKKLYIQCGALLLGDKDQDYAMKSYKTLNKLGHKVRLFSKTQLKKIFPQFSATYGVLDYHGGLLDAFLAIRIFAKLAKKQGVIFRERMKVSRIANRNIILENDEMIPFQKLVVTCGAWALELLTEQNLPIQVTKQQIIYLKPKQNKYFLKEVFPSFAYLDRGFYGFPIYGLDAVKVANHKPGRVVDPDSRGIVDNNFIKESKAFLNKYVPGLGDAEIVKSKVCHYDVTPDRDFIIDRLNENIIVGAGFSGHGFKFAPVIGNIIAKLVEDEESRFDNKRFKLRRFRL